MIKPSLLFRTRLLAYLAVWFLAAVSFQIFLKPEAITESDLGEIQQRLRWLSFTPFMVVLGLAYAIIWPSVPDGLFVFPVFTIAGLGMHGILALMLVRCRMAFVALICVQVLLLAVGAIYFIRFSRLPSGG